MAQIRTEATGAAEQQLLKKIAAKNALVAVVGLGYVGLPLSIRFAEAGFPVLGLDTDPEKVKSLRLGKSYIKTIDIGILQAAMQENRFEASGDFSLIRNADAIILCVPTPLSKHREPDLSFVVGAIETIRDHLRAGQVVILESTTYPGTTEEVIGGRLGEAGWEIGKDIFLVYSPEREDPGNQFFHTGNIPKICSGATPSCLRVGKALYEGAVDEVIPVSSPRVAELTKLLENVYRAVNIALVNELKLVAEGMGIDIFEVIRSATTKPFGYTPFYPGPGLGGHCIPIDPFYLSWKAREFGISTRFIELAGEINTAMPDYVVGQVIKALNHHGKALSQSKILVLGAAYKKNVDDMRESPSVILIKKLQALGAQVSYSDPYVPILPKMRAHDLKMESVPANPSTMAKIDCVLIATDHDCFDWEMIRELAPLIVDTRGVFSADGKKIFRA